MIDRLEKLVEKRKVIDVEKDEDVVEFQVIAKEK